MLSFCYKIRCKSNTFFYSANKINKINLLVTTFLVPADAHNADQDPQNSVRTQCPFPIVQQKVLLLLKYFSS